MPSENAPLDARSFIRHHTRLQRLTHVPELRLYLADELEPVWRATEQAGHEFPYWAAAWVGGQALARYVLDHPRLVAGTRVLDVGSGSGICALAAALAGAEVVAADVDPLACQAIALNAAANGVAVKVVPGDALATVPDESEVIVAGDMCYERKLAARLLPWLEACHRAGKCVLLADPGRPHLSRRHLHGLARDLVPASGLEDQDHISVGLFTVQEGEGSGQGRPARSPD